MMKSLLSTAAILAAIAAPVAASTTPDDVTSIAVDVRDLDLSQPADRARADRRVNAAVRSLCETSGQRTLAARTAEAECKKEALASVRRRSF